MYPYILFILQVFEKLTTTLSYFDQIVSSKSQSNAEKTINSEFD